jgi:hypothetical protein
MRVVFAAFIICSVLTAGAPTIGLAQEVSQTTTKDQSAAPPIPADEASEAGKSDNANGTNTGTTPKKSAKKKPTPGQTGKGFKFPSFKHGASATTAPATTTPATTTAPVTPVTEGAPAVEGTPPPPAAAAGAGVPPKPHVNLGLRVASIAVGGICGIPIAFVRHTKNEIVIATKELVDNSSNPWLLAIASPLGFVGGVVSGGWQCLVWGPLNAWKNSDEPFSAGTFSLGPDAG